MRFNKIYFFGISLLLHVLLIFSFFVYVRILQRATEDQPISGGSSASSSGASSGITVSGPVFSEPVFNVTVQETSQTIAKPKIFDHSPKTTTSRPASTQSSSPQGLGHGSGNSTGDGFGDQNGKNKLKTIILSKIERARRAYPPLAKKAHLTGKVIVRFDISDSGVAEKMMVSKTSGAEILDQEALAMVARASPFPVSETLNDIEVIIAFELPND